ncbi:hypothetical protein HII31_10635 [Pseudocercospora fuligena]|uniref:Glycosyl transferase CAP10 domain-containing protein n=1 Tax=Pseudocercospora fuligena TaxID=685502 RepID=A0A8H6RBM8_9PEZI|nr:hypothetical protein HII31_10635 [Pseudocercospora fuligena]
MESRVFWRRICFFLIGVAGIQLITVLYNGFGSSTAEAAGSSSAGPEMSAEDSKEDFEKVAEAWLQPSRANADWLVTKEAQVNTGHGLPDTLTEAQCTSEFPDLYRDIERAVAYWKNRQHTITAEDVDIAWRNQSNNGGGAMRILIHNQELRILESMDTISPVGYRGRAFGILGLLQRAVDSAIAGGEVLPTVEAALLFEDISNPPTDDGTHSFWTWSSLKDHDPHKRLWLIPNFDFWYSSPQGSYEAARMHAMKNDAPFAHKIPQIVWRGTEWTNKELRDGLVNIGAGKEWADIKFIDWSKTEKGNKIPVEDLCKYALTVHTEGVSYSGRLKYLLNCDSLPVVHELKWNAHYYHLLVKDGPMQNYIDAKRDWSDLPANVEYYLNNTEASNHIIANSLATFRNKYLTQAATSCYIRKLIQGYSTVSFTPDVNSIVDKGIPFEDFIEKPEDRHHL